jgi:predicted NBD/HSP70 family sugar kinase
MDDPFVLLGLFKNRCPGSGMIIHHLLLKGSTNFAGEVRHLVNYTDEIWEDIQKTRAQVVESLYVMLESFITVINPKVIALTGNNVRKDILDEVLDKIKSEIPEEHIPDFRIIPDIAPFYMNGLYNRSLDDID